MQQITIGQEDGLGTGRTSLSSPRRGGALATGLFLAALMWGPGWAAAGSFGPDPSPDVGSLSPDPAPQAAPTPARTLSQPAATVRTPATVTTTRPSAVVQPVPRPRPAKAATPTRKSAPNANPRPAAGPRRGALDLAARIDQSIPSTLDAVAGGTSPQLLAALGLFALVLASSSFLWLLHLRAEELR